MKRLCRVITRTLEVKSRPRLSSYSPVATNQRFVIIRWYEPNKIVRFFILDDRSSRVTAFEHCKIFKAKRKKASVYMDIIRRFLRIIWLPGVRWQPRRGVCAVDSPFVVFISTCSRLSPVEWWEIIVRKQRPHFASVGIAWWRKTALMKTSRTLFCNRITHAPAASFIVFFVYNFGSIWYIFWQHDKAVVK